MEEARINDEGAPVSLGTAKFAKDGFDGTGKFYCGRRLGSGAIPGSDGQCGPDGGPQCASCRRFQAPSYIGNSMPNSYGSFITIFMVRLIICIFFEELISNAINCIQSGPRAVKTVEKCLGEWNCIF